MKKKSIWLDIEEEEIEELRENLDLDILIIGGGITGLTTLYYLKDANQNIALVDQDFIGHGVSGKTTGKINYLQETVYYDIGKKYSLKKAKMYYESQKKAISEIVRIIEKEKINCDLKQVTSYVFTDKQNEVTKLKMEKKILEQFGASVQEAFENLDKLKSTYAISVSDTYVFHPVKYLRALKRICVKAGKKVYERTKVFNLHYEKNQWVCQTEKYLLKAKQVVLACHYPFFLFPYFMPIKAGIEKSYIVAFTHPFEPKTFITSKKPTVSIRYHRSEQEYMIYLSHSANLCDSLDEEKNFLEVQKEAECFSKNLLYGWKNDDLLTVDKIPYIGKLKDSLWIGTGYNTWGMTNGTLAGMILSDFLLGKENPYARLCDPKRANQLSHIGSYLANGFSSAKGYLQNKCFPKKKWYSEKITFERRNGKTIAIYDDGNKKYCVWNCCPHMGCGLVFNEVEKTWDCPCHASRFDLSGNCIKGPSRYSIAVREKK